MGKDRIGPNPGITEYTGGEFTTRFHPSKFETNKEWDQFNPAINYLQARELAASLLSQPFVETTLARMHAPNQTADQADVTLLQAGRKNAIYKVTVGPSTFVLVMSKGTAELKEEVKQEASNLENLRTRLAESKLPAFVPRVYEVCENDLVGGFSFEFLPNHMELRAATARMIYPDTQSYYTMFQVVDDRQTAQAFNKRIQKHIRKLMFLPQKRKEEDPNFRIKTELLARLFLIYKVMGAVPRQFSVNAGDFMIDPTKEDFDPRIITARGGWLPIVGNEDFARWIFDCEFAPPTVEELLQGANRPLFDYDPFVIQKGLYKGLQMFAQATKS